ncbi:hypothetical protein [Bosea sp. TAF32]|uniref:hypothetical protein n=1 Tax=Bosea sp. TAF32 TaxID=3237482 RepID=UPI003F936CDF
MIALLQALNNANGASNQQFVCVVHKPANSSPIGVSRRSQSRQGGPLFRFCAVRERGAVSRSVELERLNPMQNRTGCFRPISFDVGFRREDEARGQPARLLRVSLRANHLKGQLSHHDELSIGTALKQLDIGMKIEQPAPIPRLNNATRSQAQRREVKANHPAPVSFTYIYRWNRCDRKGQRCRVFARGTMNSVGLEFEDGFRMVSSGNALRRA